jgi:predicted dehydrogenase
MAVSGSPLDIGLIGLGAWARAAYVPILQERSDVKVRAVAARTEETRSHAASLLGADVALYADYSELLQYAPVDAVMIGLPSETTAGVCIAALEAGKHVWFEPPLTDTDETGCLLDLADLSELVFHADLELRYLPVVGALRDLLARGDLGRPLLVRVEMENGWARESAFDDDAPESMAGTLSTWYVDLMDALFEKPARRMDLYGSRPRHESVVEVGTAAVQFSDEAFGEWAFNLRSGEDLALRIKVAGTEGEAEANLLTGAYRHRVRDSDWISGAADCSRPIHGFVGMRESVQAFLSAVWGHGRTKSGADVYRRVHAIQTALHRSEAEGTPIAGGTG